MTEAKEIRFITPVYQELFRIPDGGRVWVTRADGLDFAVECKYIDDAHFYGNGECYHICQFAEKLQEIEATVKPDTDPIIVSGYRVIKRESGGGKTFVMAHNPKAVQPFVTWQENPDRTAYDYGHYCTKNNDAVTNMVRRVHAAREGRVYTQEDWARDLARNRKSDKDRG